MSVPSSSQKTPQEEIADDLVSSYLDITEQKRKTIIELRKIRAQIPLVSITLLTAILPFAKEHTDYMLAFFVGYVSIFIAAACGVLGMEGVFRFEIQCFTEFQRIAYKFIDKPQKIKNANDVKKKLRKAWEDKNLDEAIYSRLSDLSVKWFLFGLAMLFAAIFPWNLLSDFLREVVNEIKAAS